MTSNALNEKPVPFGPDGALRARTGTTTYLNAATFNTEAIQYVHLANLSSPAPFSDSTQTNQIVAFAKPVRIAITPRMFLLP
ncbi:hypothetical protein H310_12785 [Aphanomyces invadans]|uniref:Uncharacterized protein n=1 Tax=Aphanomyces invadans TaxID=157072 RepID=A0A024TGP2_9STRA|nr:hypothetical protein H310_12785 [Aphanomyces invadans]ETV93179.1 hypothetical protein H310_12785 [Aphanomyces invadans]|eukprot:XP_008878201.1 hypothetical protein H310_12785 [Aphanomyces invadans]